MKTFRKLFNGWAIIMLIMMLPVSVLASPGDGGQTVSVGGYLVSLAFAEPPKTGLNTIHVTVLDEMGMPIRLALVEIRALPVEETDEHEENMGHNEPDSAHTEPSQVTESGHGEEAADSGNGDESGHGGEEAAGDNAGETVKTVLMPEHDAGEYAGEITFLNTGHWMLTVHFSIDEEIFEADFPVKVTGNSPSGVILAGFASLNAVLIGVAAITRRKPVSA